MMMTSASEFDEVSLPLVHAVLGWGGVGWASVSHLTSCAVRSWPMSCGPGVMHTSRPLAISVQVRYRSIAHTLAAQCRPSDSSGD